MATNTELVQQLYVAYFNRPGDAAGVEFYVGVLDAGASLEAVRADFVKAKEYTDTYAGKSNEAIVDQIYFNIFGHHADVPGLKYYAGQLASGAITIDKLPTIIANGAQSTDITAFDSKVAAAAAFTDKIAGDAELRIAYANGGAAAVTTAHDFLAGVNDEASLAAAIAVLPATVANIIPSTSSSLTKGLDNFVGTSGNDTILGGIDSTAGSELNTLSGIDNINGGGGIDTLKIAHNSGDITVGNLRNVEIVSIDSAATAGLTVNTSAISDITNLNVTKAAGAIVATAAATTSVGVSLKEVGAITINGGKDVNVAVTDRANALIDVGATGTDPSGNVTIDVTGKAAVNNVANTTLGNINVGGGKAVTVTQHATSSSSAIVADGTTEKVTQGNVTVTASGITTDVTVTQDAAVAAASRAAVAGATEVASVKFSALKSGESVTVGSLTFTASKDLTAAQVAQAFANLSSGAATPTDVTPTTATGDTQGSAVRANGVFTGSLLADWSSAEADASGTVVFTAKANTFMADLTATAKATVTTTTQGVTAVSAKNTLGVDAGTVTIAGGAVLKNVTVDGFATSTGAAGVTGGSNTALDTIKLSNGGSFDIDSAAATLNLTADNVDGTITVAAGTKTLNAAISGADAETTLKSATAETVNVSGSGHVVGATGAGNLDVATAINTSAMAAEGTATFTIANGTVTTYTGGAGTDTVTVANAGTAVSKAIDLGAGDDVLTLQGTVVAPSAALSGGAGSDTIAMNGASAAALSANGTFAGKIDGFEKLGITDNVAAATTVNMANMDGITYVVSNNSSSVSAPAVKEVFTVDFTASGAITGNDTIAFDGRTVNLTTGDTPATIAAKFALAGAGTAWDVSNVSGSVVTFTAKTAGVRTDVVAADFTVTNADATTAAAVVSANVNGTAGTPETFSVNFGTSGVIEGADTITFGGKTITLATGDTPANIAAKVAAAGFAAWNTVVNGTSVDFTAKANGDVADPVSGDFVIVNTASTTTAVVGTPVVTTQGAAIGAGAPALTIDKLAKDGTLELVDGGAGVIVKMADASGAADTFNLVTKVVGTGLNFGTVDVAGVETIKYSAIDSDTDGAVDTATVNIKADKATLLTIDGSSNAIVTLDATTTKLVTINASALTGDLTVSANSANAMTITGGSGNDLLFASVGADAKADVINGGAGNDMIYVGSNGAKLTGGEGNDTFVVTASSATGGNKQANTYSEITDFKAGDLLQLQSSHAGGAAVDAASFAKLAASLNDSTAIFSDFVNAAVKEAGVDGAVWFSYKGDTYVVVDSGADTDAFVNGQDLIVKLTGINGDNLSWNADFATVALV